MLEYISIQFSSFIHKRMLFALVTLKMHHVILVSLFRYPRESVAIHFFSIVGVREILCISIIFRSLREFSLMDLEFPIRTCNDFRVYEIFPKYAGMYV